MMAVVVSAVLVAMTVAVRLGKSDRGQQAGHESSRLHVDVWDEKDRLIDGLSAVRNECG